jgi:hypothetical protein
MSPESMKIPIRPVTARQAAVRSARKTIHSRAFFRCLLAGVALLWCGIQSAGAQSLQSNAKNVASRPEGIPGQGQPGGIIFSEADTVTIPEPGAIAMLLGGFGTLLGFQRFRRRH